MCGIGGVIVRDGVPDMMALSRMRSALSHRGPDDHDIVLRGNVGLVHTRLSIVDPSPAGHQPMADSTGRWLLTYNGEIYNHLRLRAQRLPGTSYRGGSDSETLVELLARRGIGEVAELQGIFAFAALDLERSMLHLCRDAFGVKPLYFTQTAGALWFASEIGALLAAGVPAVPRVDALRHALARRWVSGTATVFDGVHRLDPGSTVSIDVRTMSTSVNSWYHPTLDVDPNRAADLAAMSAGQTTALVEEHLRSAVRAQLMADVPLGTMCSGGIDSSLLTAFAREELPHLHAFNVSIVDQPEHDEGPWAEAVAAHLDVELHTVRLDAEGWLAGLVPAVKHFEYPLSYEASVGLAALAERARADGVKVLLSGEGADELLGGYPWMHHRHSADFAARNSAIARFRRVLGRARETVLSKGTTSLPFLPESESYDRAEVTRAVAAYRHHPGVRRNFEADLLSEFRVSLPQILARGDKNTMQHSIEARVPFLDRDLVALCINLPLQHRLEPTRKNPLVELGKRYLPPGLATRPKIGFSFDVSGYLGSRASRAFLEQGLLRDVLGITTSAWRDQIELDPHRGSMLLWTSEIWARLFLGGESVEIVEEALFRSSGRRRPSTESGFEASEG